MLRVMAEVVAARRQGFQAKQVRGAVRAPPGAHARCSEGVLASVRGSGRCAHPRVAR